jgi:hypothetical protein
MECNPIGWMGARCCCLFLQHLLVPWRMHQRAWRRRPHASLLAVGWCVEGPAVILDAVVVGWSVNTGVLCCDGWRQRRERLALCLGARVAVDAGVIWFAAEIASELAARELVSTYGGAVHVPAVARHLARRWGWCGGASCVCADLLRVEVAALVLLAGANQGIAAVFGGGALEFLGRNHRNLIALHLHGRADLAIRTRESDVGAADIAPNVVVPRGKFASECATYEECAAVVCSR